MSKERIIRNFRITIRYYTMGNCRIYTGLIWWCLMFILEWNGGLKRKEYNSNTYLIVITDCYGETDEVYSAKAINDIDELPEEF